MASVDELASKYPSQLKQLKAIFPTWEESDLAFTLSDTKGNIDEAAMMIFEGRASQFTQATKKKGPKPKETYTKSHSNRNADSGGWDAVESEERGDRGARGGRGGRGGGRGGRGGRGGEPFRGGRGGRGGSRGGRGGYSNGGGDSSYAKASDGNNTTTATTSDGWATQVQAAAAGDDDGWGVTDAPAEPEPSKGDDFSAAGGWGDAPAAKEIEKAAKSGSNGWEEEIKKPVPVAQPVVPAAKPKMTWAQIAKPQEKPKPVPPPAPIAEPVVEPETTSDEPVAQDETAVPESEDAEATEEPEAWGDAPAAEELEAQAAALEEDQPAEETYTNGEAEVSAQEPEAEWSDPAIAGSGAEPSWATQTAPAPTVPEPPTTYTGPPGFNPVISKAQAAVQQPRTNSRATQRYKTADGQAVVLPPMASGMGSMEMQFGSLSFGGLNGDGVEAPPAPEPQAEAPRVAVSPVRSTQPAAPAQPTPAPVPTQTQTPFSSELYAQQPTQPAQTQQSQPPSSYTAQHQPQQQQQQMHQYQNQYAQPAHAQTQGQHEPAHQQQQQQPQYGGYQRQEWYNPAAQLAENAQSQGLAQQHTASSPYEAFGGNSQAGHFGHQAQAPSQDIYGQSGAYDSYASSGYPRPPMEEPKQAVPAPTHTPTATAQTQHGVPQQQGGYYSQMGNMSGYYAQAAYNPYYQYGQGPNPGFQQYYPMANRNLYGQPAAPPAPAKPAASPYGAPVYPSSASFDESFSGLSRFGAEQGQQQQTKSQQQSQQAQPTQIPSYQQQQQGHHGYLGNSQSTPSSIQQRPGPVPTGNGGGSGTPDEVYGKSVSQTGSRVGGVSQQSQQSHHNQNQGQRGGPQYGGYGGYGGYQAHQQSQGSSLGQQAPGLPQPQAQAQNQGQGIQQQDWSQYGNHYGGARNGYTNWQ